MSQVALPGSTTITSPGTSLHDDMALQARSFCLSFDRCRYSLRHSRKPCPALCNRQQFLHTKWQLAGCPSVRIEHQPTCVKSCHQGYDKSVLETCRGCCVLAKVIPAADLCNAARVLYQEICGHHDRSHLTREEWTIGTNRF